MLSPEGIINSGSFMMMKISARVGRNLIAPYVSNEVCNDMCSVNRSKAQSQN